MEQDPRFDFLDLLLASPHGKLVEYGACHQKMLLADPDFYGRVASWYQVHGVIRDQRLLFAAHLALSAWPEHREAAFVLLQRLRTYEVARLVRYLKEKVHRLPRRVRSAVCWWLRRREENHAWFDEVALRDRKNLKYLYATLRLRPDERAEAILFQRKIPPDSRIAVVRRLAASNDSAEIARQIIEHRIFYSTAVGALKNIDTPILVALITVMSPQQLLNQLSALQRRGALKHPRVQALVEKKLERAATESRVQDARLLVAAQICGDKKLTHRLGEIASQRLQQRGQIHRPTALFVDKSASMEMALHVGAHLASLCSTVAQAGLRVYAFDGAARRVPPPQIDTLTGWCRSFSRLRPGGCTSIGAPFLLLERDQHKAEQIVIITDGEENTAPYFVPALRAYEKRVGFRCSVIVLLVGEQSEKKSFLERELAENRIDHSVFLFSGDLYSLPGLVPYLSWPRRAELCTEILGTPLPTRHDLDSLPPGFDPHTCELL